MMDASNTNSEYAAEAHKEYLAEAERLVDQQVEALFNRISGLASQAGAAQPVLAHNGRSLRIDRGGHAVSFDVEAITDLPEDTDRAQVFPVSQARCIVHALDGTTSEWQLHRLGEGNATPPYTWVNAQSGAPVSDEEIRQLLQEASSR